jgi:hypothetical protein
LRGALAAARADRGDDARLRARQGIAAIGCELHDFGALAQLDPHRLRNFLIRATAFAQDERYLLGSRRPRRPRRREDR